MAGFTLVGSACLDHTATLTQDTASVATQAGDILLISAAGTVWAGATATQTGATWQQIGFHESDAGGSVAAYQSTGGAGSGAITVTEDNNDFADLCWAVVRPTDADTPTKDGGNTTGGTSADTLTVDLSGSSKTIFLAYGHTNSAGRVFATDSGWTELLDQNHASGGSHQIQYRVTDDTQVIFDANLDALMQAIVVGFSEPAGATDETGKLLDGSAHGAGVGPRLVGGSRLLQRRIERLGSLVPVTAQLQG